MNTFLKGYYNKMKNIMCMYTYTIAYKFYNCQAIYITEL